MGYCGYLWLSVANWYNMVQFTSLHHLGHLADGDFWLKDECGDQMRHDTSRHTERQLQKRRSA